MCKSLSGVHPGEWGRDLAGQIHLQSTRVWKCPPKVDARRRTQGAAHPQGHPVVRADARHHKGVSPRLGADRERQPCRLRRGIRVQGRRGAGGGRATHKPTAVSARRRHAQHFNIPGLPEWHQKLQTGHQGGCCWRQHRSSRTGNLNFLWEIFDSNWIFVSLSW